MQIKQNLLHFSASSITARLFRVIFAVQNDGIMSGYFKPFHPKEFLTFNTIDLIHLLALITLLAASGSCSKADYPHKAVLAISPETMTTVVLSYGQTKVPGKNIDRIDIFCFEENEAGLLDTFTRMETEGMNSLEINSGAGVRRIVAIANLEGEYYRNIRSLSDMQRLIINMDDDNPESPVMTGQITAVTGGIIRIRLEPIMSFIRIDEIETTIDINNLRVFLRNANKACPLLHSDDYLPTDIFDTQQLPATAGTSFMCYPNDILEESLGCQYTRLVFAGEINDTTWYWPINVNRSPYGQVVGKPGIGRNSEYGYNIRITKKGVLDPDLPIWLGDASVTLHPGQLIFTHTGEYVHIWCETNPCWAELEFSRDDLEDDAREGIYEYEMDADGKGVTLHMLRGGTGMFTVDAGYPVNDGYLILVICDP